MSDRDQPSVTPPASSAPLLTPAAWARSIPFLVYLLFIVVADLLGRFGVPAADLRWLYALKIAAVSAALLFYWRHYTELHTLRLGPTSAGLAVIVGALVFVLWIGLGASWLVIGTPIGFDPRSAGHIDSLMVAVRIAGAALVVPVMEELFWRSFLLRWLDSASFLALDPAKVRPQSVAIAALLFGIEHHQWLAGIVAGVAYSVLYMRHKSLWSPILAHAVTNAVLGGWIVHTANWSYW